MTEDLIKEFFCTFINSLGFTAIKSPANKQAPIGTYYSVGTASVDSHGTLHERPARAGEPAKPRVYQNSVTLVIWEVEGSGEGIRTIRNRIDTDEFRTLIHAQGMSVWKMGSIIDMSQADGEFFIRQKRMELTCAFNDIVDGTSVSMESVEGSGSVDGTDVAIPFSIGNQ